MITTTDSEKRVSLDTAGVDAGFGKATLRRARLVGDNLEHASFTSADLTDADMRVVAHKRVRMIRQLEKASWPGGAFMT